MPIVGTQLPIRGQSGDAARSAEKKRKKIKEKVGESALWVKLMSRHVMWLLPNRDSSPRVSLISLVASFQDKEPSTHVPTMPTNNSCGV